MTFLEMQELVNAVTYKPGWMVVLKSESYITTDAHGRLTPKSRPYIQIEVTEDTEAALSPFTGERMAWRGGKRYLSYHMCRQEVVGACLGAIKDAEMHEIHEWFKYRGRSIFNPHTDPDALVELVKYKRNLNMRENAMTMEEPQEDDTEVYLLE